MFNEQLYKELETLYGVERMMSFAEIEATKYDLLFADSDDPLNEGNFERDWWLNKHAELLAVPKDIAAVEDIKSVLLERGYTDITQIRNRNEFDDDTK